ncbi:cell envelope integrity protein CreD [soil metagenome]
MLVLLRHSVIAKVIGLLLLTLLLCIPLARIDMLNRERGESQREAAEELASTYAGAQTLVAPVLVVPYLERWTETQRDAKGRITGTEVRTRAQRHVVFPDKLDIDGSLTPQMRYRGIFRIPFYALRATLSGGFAGFDPRDMAREESDSRIEIGTPFIALHVSDLRGLDGSPTLTLEGETLAFAQRIPGLAPKSPYADGLHAPLSGQALAAWRAGRPLPFNLALGLVGHETLSLVPIANETTAHLQSSWAHPSFGGRFLATERSVGAQGFDARWRISSLVTSAREQVRAGMVGRDLSARDVAVAVAVGSDEAAAMRAADERASGPLQTFDVTLAQPLNVYAMSTRAGKYGALFIALVLMAAFMVELFRKLRLHPVQYALVGLSIALFFLLLLALSEKLMFWQAYTLAAGASVAVLGFYFGGVLASHRLGLAFAGYIALLYAALYGLLASENDALLLGALLVFGMLSLLMLATRKVDWYALGGTAAPVTAAASPTDKADKTDVSAAAAATAG